jgi:hypothetical protein
MKNVLEKSSPFQMKNVLIKSSPFSYGKCADKVQLRRMKNVRIKSSSEE